MIDWSLFPLRILARLKEHPAIRGGRRQPKIWRDTSNFTSIDYGDIILVDNRYFLVTGYTREGRFGIDDQPKQWVPKVQDLETGESNILKLVFHETYKIRFGELEVTCYRSPEKEARVLELVRGARRRARPHHRRGGLRARRAVRAGALGAAARLRGAPPSRQRGGRVVTVTPGLPEYTQRHGPVGGLLRFGVSFAAVVGRARLKRGVSVWLATRRADGRLLSDLARLAQNGALRPVVDRTFPLARAADAHRYLETGHARGKVLLVPHTS